MCVVSSQDAQLQQAVSLAGGAIAGADDPALAAMPREGLLHVAPVAAAAGGAGPPHEPAPHDQLSITPECLLVSAAAAVAGSGAGDLEATTTPKPDLAPL